MDTGSLVDARRDAIRSAQEFLRLLDKARVPVRSYFWYREPSDENADEWRLFVASPLVDDRGPSAFFTTLERYLKDFPQRSSIEDAITTASPSSALIDSLSKANHFVTSSSSTAPVELRDAVVYRLVPSR